MQFDEAAEQRYRKRRVKETVPIVRACFPVGVIFNYLFLFMDRQAGIDLHVAVETRTVWSAALIAAVLVTFSRIGHDRLPWPVTLGGLVGAATMSFIMVITPGGTNRHIPGLIMLYLALVAMAPTFRIAMWNIIGLLVIPNIVMVYFRIPTTELVAANAFLFLAAILCSIISFLIDRGHRAAFTLELEMQRWATTDALTGLANRHLFYDQARREIARMQRYGTVLAVIAIDVDHFKQINDTWGHDVGDLVLNAVGSVLRESARDPDVVARLGGEEFAVLAVGADIAAAAVLAERIRRNINDFEIHHDGPPLRVTASLGCSAVTAGELSIDPAVKRADTALYQAKSNGRNQVHIAALANGAS